MPCLVQKPLDVPTTTQRKYTSTAPNNTPLVSHERAGQTAKRVEAQRRVLHHDGTGHVCAGKAALLARNLRGLALQFCDGG